MDGKSVTGRFRLLDYFKLTSLVIFSVVAVAMYLLERAEHQFFEATTIEQSAAFAQAQAELVGEQKTTARNGLLVEHEAGHITLTKILANSLWQTHFAPLVAQAQQLPAGAGERIRRLPGFARADAAVNAMMKHTSVFKVKVYDLRGLTVYSSEHAQIGEDKKDNRGWKSAVLGVPASELVHRDKFSAFEGTVEDRDLIQSYVPVRGAAGDIEGVFEIYSDVTPLLYHLNSASVRIGGVAAANQAKVEAASLGNRNKVEANSRRHFAVMMALLAALYVALYLLVRNGQRIIDEQARAREAAALREHLMHGEKMAALATMAANASHEIGNPLAIIAGFAEDLVRAQQAGEPVKPMADSILGETRRIAELTRKITEFSSRRSEQREPLDVNEMIRSVRDFMSYDTRYQRTRFDAALQPELPVCVGIPDHLNEVLMILLQAYAEASLAAGSRVAVGTEQRNREVVVRVECQCGPERGKCDAAGDPRLDSARQRVEGMGGRFAMAGTAAEIYLPCY